MKAFEILSGSAYVVELSEGAYGFRLFKDEQPYLSYWVKTYTGRINLPPGTWQIVGLLSEVTEEQAAELVESELNAMRTKIVYKHYKDSPMWFFTALESLESAILAEGWYFENPVKIHTWASENADDYRKQWEEGKKRVLSRERCVILRKTS